MRPAAIRQQRALAAKKRGDADAFGFYSFARSLAEECEVVTAVDGPRLDFALSAPHKLANSTMSVPTPKVRHMGQLHGTAEIACR